MCVGLDETQMIKTGVLLTVIPDAICSIALKHLPPNNLPPLSCRGITVCVISLGYLALNGDVIVGNAAFLYGMLLQLKPIYSFGKFFFQAVNDYLNLEDELSLKLKTIHDMMLQLNQANIGTRPYKKRYNRLMDRFSRVSPDTIIEIRNDTQQLINDFCSYYANILNARSRFVS